MVVRARDPFVWLAPELAGDESAYTEYAKRVTRSLTCYFAGNRCEAADDLASETLLRLMEKIEDIEPERSDSEAARRRYLFGVARNVLREWWRRPDAREIHLQDDEGPEYSLPPIDLISTECLKLLRDAVQMSLAKLSAIDQDILRRSELDPDYAPTLAELAREIGGQPAAMRQRARRARIRFKDLVLASNRLDDLLRCLGIERTDA